MQTIHFVHDQAELHEQIKAMTEEEASEVKLIYAPDWPDKATPITEVLDGIPGAWERAQESIEQVRRGETAPLSEL